MINKNKGEKMKQKMSILCHLPLDGRSRGNMALYTAGFPVKRGRTKKIKCHSEWGLSPEESIESGFFGR